MSKTAFDSPSEWKAFDIHHTNYLFFGHFQFLGHMGGMGSKYFDEEYGVRFPTRIQSF
jgi:hypothetical protein